MSPTAGDSEAELLRRLRAAPELFVAVAKSAGQPDLQRQRILRQDWPDDLVRAALTLADLRHKAKAKFTLAESMWFDRVCLEQSTAETVARHKADRFRQRIDDSEETIADLCCGIGADAIALAEHFPVHAVDADPARCLMTGWNATAYGVADRVTTICADVTTLSDLPRFVHIDPDRRAGKTGRSRRVEDSQPGLEYLQQLMTRRDGGAIKLSPAANFGGSFTDVEFELTSLNGECKECTVWFGGLGEAGLWRATTLPSGETLAGHPLDAFPSLGPLQRFLYEPDPAVVRAGLVDLLAEQFGLSRLDDDEEFLTGDALIESPFVSAFDVLADLPNNEREIRRYFRDGDFQQVEIKCRRIPVKVEDLRRKLSLDGSQPAVLVIARLAGKARAIVAQRR